MFETMIRNSWTTVVGILVGVANFLGGVGAKAPQTKQEWWALLMSLLYVIFGVVSKDATTGSRPGSGSANDSTP
jgi:hypothetical protein